MFLAFTHRKHDSEGKDKFRYVKLTQGFVDLLTSQWFQKEGAGKDGIKLLVKRYRGEFSERPDNWKDKDEKYK